MIQIMERISGLVSFASGAISVLKMMGIIKDPVKVALAKILAEINSIKDTLAQMDAKLDAITQQLIDMAVSQEEKDRQLNARLLLSYWRDFNTNYVEPLRASLTEYEGYINSGIRSWWESATHDGVRVLYADYKDETVMTLSNKGYDEGFPEIADNGETVLADKSFGITADIVPVTNDVPFDINTYTETFTDKFVAAFIPAANDKKLDATDAFYAEWDALDDDGKTERATAYASDFLATVTYHLSCRIMSTDDMNRGSLSASDRRAKASFLSSIQDSRLLRNW